MQKDLQNGYVVKIDLCTENAKSVSYLPLHPVSNENKPGKIRRVTNASSIFQGQSFNSSLQAAWNHRPKWDKPLDLNEFADLTQLQNELREFCEISIPRCLFIIKTIKETALHTFSDASEYALSAISYLRIEYVDETVQVKFIMGKARVAPIKRMTIPNLELQAAVYAAQLAQFVTEEHDIHINEKVFWSDSTTVLYWLRTP